MKIGLEFEGVIIDSQTREITRWKNIPEQKQKNICRLINYGENDAKVLPIDTYDCLAEVRTRPLENVSARDMLYSLFSLIERTNRAYESAGYTILWKEMEIPEKLHTEISCEIDADPNKSKKATYTINNNGIESYYSKGNRFRGGGIHVNVSPIPTIIAPAFILELHKIMRAHSHKADGKQFQSQYRKNILYRTRIENNEAIAEYMSFGFEFPDTLGTNGKQPVSEIFDIVKHQFHWAEACILVVNSFIGSLKV